jgi:hypothetical protein
MYVLGTILNKTMEKGEYVLEECFLKPHYGDFNYSYQFNGLGEIVNKEPRHFTERNENETTRYKRIAIEAIYDYNNKDNRNLKPILTETEKDSLRIICNNILLDADIRTIKTSIIKLMENIQLRIISSL